MKKVTTEATGSLGSSRVASGGRAAATEPASPVGKSQRTGTRKVGPASQPGGAPGGNHESQACAVPLEYANLDAREVHVAGTFNDWNPSATPMTRHRDGKWSTVLLLLPGHYEYRFVVDGHWLNDPLAEMFVANPYSGLNCVLEVKVTAASEATRA